MTHAATYWTGIWDPAREAISKEVALIRHALAPGSTVVSFSSGQRSSWLGRDRVLRLSAERWLLYRAVAAALERRGRVSHVFGELGAWHPLRALGRRPILFTVAVPSALGDGSLLHKVTLFAPETEALGARLAGAGVPSERIRVIPPGIDLDYFAPTPLPTGRFTLLFASSPNRVEELEARGVPLLVELARAMPDLDLVLLWRRWGDIPRTEAALAALDLPPNVLVQWADLPDPRPAYAAAHAVVCAYRAGYGKSCPNSVIEGLACGRPAIVTDTTGIADTLRRQGGGVVTARSLDGLAHGVVQLRRRLATHASDARRVAESHFALSAFLRSYADAYQSLGTGTSHRAAGASSANSAS